MKIYSSAAIDTEETVWERVVPEDMFAVASLNVRLESALVNAPCVGLVADELLLQETVTEGEADVFDLHILALNDIVKLLIVAPVLF